MGTKEASLIELHSDFSEHILVKNRYIQNCCIDTVYWKCAVFGPLFSYSRPNYSYI